MSDAPTICEFKHRGLTGLSNPVFRLTSGDNLPALVINLDAGQAVLPLGSVAKLFGIAPGTPDERMLRLVGDALRFVPTIRIGDKLPLEVLTGEASWTPSPEHRRLATNCLQLRLVEWLATSDIGEHEVTPELLIAAFENPEARPRVGVALHRLAEQLGLQGGGPAVSALLDDLGSELAYIEALRDRLHIPVQVMAKQLVLYLQDTALLAGGRRETLFQVSRLATKAVNEIGHRFDAVDARTCEITPALRDLHTKRDGLWAERDWLYCAQKAWEPFLRDWKALPVTGEDGLWRLLDRLYRFLAPTYMTVQEWQQTVTRTGAPERSRAALVW